jgi:hypothetical protein
MSGNRLWAIGVSVVLAAIAATGCEAWLIEEPTPAVLPTRTPTPGPTDTPAVPPTPTYLPATPSPTITLTPIHSPTPPLAPTSTPSGDQMTAVALGPDDLDAPLISYFVAFPTDIDPGESVLLFWSSRKGIAAAVYNLKYDGSPGRTWEVDVEGSLTVTPQLRGRHEIYVLAVTNGVVTVERSLGVYVTCPTGWFFDPPPEEGCPEPEVQISEATTQQFEHGRMFWVGATGEIIVLFEAPLDLLGVEEDTGEGEGEDEAEDEAEGEDESEEEDEIPPAWLIFTGPFAAGQPEGEPSPETPEGELPPAALDEAPTATPEGGSTAEATQEDRPTPLPEGFREPTGGFGVVWRDNPDVRERLGWAIGEEEVFSMTWQREVIPEAEWLYFTDHQSAVVMLEPEGVGWQVIAHQ